MLKRRKELIDDLHKKSFFFLDLCPWRAAQTFSLSANFQLQFWLPPHPAELRVRISGAVRILSGSWFLSLKWIWIGAGDRWNAANQTRGGTEKTICEMFFKTDISGLFSVMEEYQHSVPLPQHSNKDLSTLCWQILRRWSCVRWHLVTAHSSGCISNPGFLVHSAKISGTMHRDAENYFLCVLQFFFCSSWPVRLSTPVKKRTQKIQVTRQSHQLVCFKP